MYALYSNPETEKFPDYIEWENNIPAKRSAIYCLQNGKKVKWEIKNNRVRVYLPQNLKTEVNALAFSFTRQAIHQKAKATLTLSALANSLRSLQRKRDVNPVLWLQRWARTVTIVVPK